MQAQFHRRAPSGVVVVISMTITIVLPWMTLAASSSLSVAADDGAC